MSAEQQRNMQAGTHPSSGPVTQFLEDDHQRLEKLLNAAVLTGGRIEQGHYDEFRAGLLRHIGMEEKILLPAAQRSNGGAPLSMAATLRLDHGAIAALLVPSPTPKLIAVLRSILNKHNEVEEGLDGLYAICDKLASAQTEDLMAKLRAAPAVAVLPYSDTPAVLGAVRRALKRAKYEYLSDSTRF
jgi:Hemerythrin HHE cation binding domain